MGVRKPVMLVLDVAMGLDIMDVNLTTASPEAPRVQGVTWVILDVGSGMDLKPRPKPRSTALGSRDWLKGCRKGRKRINNVIACI